MFLLKKPGVFWKTVILKMTSFFEKGWGFLKARGFLKNGDFENDVIF